MQISNHFQFLQLQKNVAHFFVSRPQSPLRTTNLKPQTSRGFSLLEVLITAAIIGIITGIVTLRYGSFNNLVLLKNQSYEVALDLRETQTRALSVVGADDEFRRPYGVYFSTDQSDLYMIFRDSNSNGYYNAGEEIETRRLDSRFHIHKLCSGSNCSLSSMSVTFQRPNFDAIINNGSIADGGIGIETLNGTGERLVRVNAAGQITVE